MTSSQTDTARLQWLTRCPCRGDRSGHGAGKGSDILLFGPPGVGKSHLGSAIGLARVEKGYRVLFSRTTDLVQKLQQARRDLVLESAIAKLDKFHLSGMGLGPMAASCRTPR